MELINCSIVTVILCQLNIISKNSISETIISCDRVYNCLTTLRMNSLFFCRVLYI